MPREPLTTTGQVVSSRNFRKKKAAKYIEWGPVFYSFNVVKDPAVYPSGEMPLTAGQRAWLQWAAAKYRECRESTWARQLECSEQIMIPYWVLEQRGRILHGY